MLIFISPFLLIAFLNPLTIRRNARRFWGGFFEKYLKIFQILSPYAEKTVVLYPLCFRFFFARQLKHKCSLLSYRQKIWCKKENKKCQIHWYTTDSTTQFKNRFLVIFIIRNNNCNFHVKIIDFIFSEKMQFFIFGVLTKK